MKRKKQRIGTFRSLTIWRTKVLGETKNYHLSRATVAYELKHQFSKNQHQRGHWFYFPTKNQTVPNDLEMNIDFYFAFYFTHQREINESVILEKCIKLELDWVRLNFLIANSTFYLQNISTSELVCKTCT